MKISSAFPSKYIQTADLGGQDRIVTIAGVRMEEVGSGSDTQNLPVLYFRGAQKGLVLNKTNGQTIAEMHGDETDSWAGKQITLFPTQTDFQGRQTPCIRIRLQAPQADFAPSSDAFGGDADKKPGGLEQLDDEIPF